MNTIGYTFRFTDFGESHGVAVGGVVDGYPAGLHIDNAAIRVDLDRRAGRTLPVEWQFAVSPRALSEQDEPEFLSGLLDNITLGTPVAFLIRNTNVRSEDYETLKNICRPAHADAVYQNKYGIRDYRGGGRASARETAARVVAGSMAKQYLQTRNITIGAYIAQVGDAVTQEDITSLLKRVKAEGDSVGGIVECVVRGLPVGVGEPLFDKLPARLAAAVMSINACKGFDYGSGFCGVNQWGSDLNQVSGGALGGISDGTDFHFRCVFKPTPSMAKNIPGGRFDVCIALRAPVIVEAMAAMTIADLVIQSESGI